MSILHGAEGFRGNAKGKGFRAYLEAEKIPPRGVYRLIRRYRRIRAIWDSVHVANAQLEKEIFPPISLAESNALLTKLSSALETPKANGDTDTVSDAPTENAHEVAGR